MEWKTLYIKGRYFVEMSRANSYSYNLELSLVIIESIEMEEIVKAIDWI